MSSGKKLNGNFGAHRLVGAVWCDLRRVSLRVGKTLGAFELLLNSAWRQKRLLILCYHGVSMRDEHEWNPKLYMPASALRTRLEILRQSRCALLPLPAAVQRLYDGTLPPRSVAVTFDDGCVDFHQQAYPLLREFDVPVTVYLATYRCGQMRPIFHLVVPYMLWKARGADGRALADLIDDRSGRFELSTADGRRRAFEAIFGVAKPLSMSDKDLLAARIGERLGIDYEELARLRLFTIMPPNEVQALAAAGVMFELHTHSHKTPETVDQFDYEIATNRDAIARMTGHHSRHFCYPSGYYRPELLRWLQHREVVSATTCDPGLASARSNRLLLPRFVDATSVTPVEFEGWVSGAASLVSRHRSYGQPVVAPESRPVQSRGRL